MKSKLKNPSEDIKADLSEKIEEIEELPKEISSKLIHEYRLIAKTLFRHYRRGDVITDFDEIESILKSEEQSLVAKIKVEGK